MIVEMYVGLLHVQPSLSHRAPLFTIQLGDRKYITYSNTRLLLSYLNNTVLSFFPLLPRAFSP